MDSYFPLTNLVPAAICFLALLATIFFIRKSRSHLENKTTASSLTVLSPPSLSPPNWIHHVFPSFHGADVRKNFLSHIVKEFRRKGIDLFIDNDIERSKSIGPELIEAIKGSRIAFVLVSKNYSSSTWCLNELVEIIKCREELDQTVMSIFYEVDPTDVKKQTGDFGKVFRKTCKGKTKDEIQRWKHALTEVAQIAGYHSSNWETEAEMISAIATEVSNKLNLSAPCSDFDGLVGMESQMTKMRRLLQLDSDEVRKIGILGPPGIGKTTIARSLFNRYSQDFQLSAFIYNIKRNYARPACSEDYSVKLDLQKQFMSQLTNETGIKVPHLGIAKDRLRDKKVLIVLDDVDRSLQVEAMAKETCWFGPGSRIIVTTQDQKVLKATGINHVYKVKLPTNHEALQIFCMHAFGKKYPKDGFKKLACEVRSLVGKLPLGLRVMGSYFRGMSKQDWTEALPRLRTHIDRDGEIASILKFSYEALNNEDKRLFLHIACLFQNDKFDTVEACLASCFLDVTQGFRVLAEKSLISIKSGWIEMPELLVQLGRRIVREQSDSEPRKRQFVFDAIDIGEILSDDYTDGSSVIGINLEANKDITWTSERAFERLSNLQFLRILGRGVNPQSMKYISRKLRILSWASFQMPCFPSSFNPRFLVKLEMLGSELEKLWETTQPLSNLKWMDLTCSKSLKELPDLSTATNLLKLDLSYCSSLVMLPSSIGNAVNLQTLDLSYCLSLAALPSSIGNAVNLQTLDLSYCLSLAALPSSIGNAVNLQNLDLKCCSSLVMLPSSIGNAINLEQLSLQCCSSLVEIPFSIGNMINLFNLDLSYCSSLVDLPSSMKNLGRLRRLELEQCSKLEVNLANFKLEYLEKLNLSGCSSLKNSPESSTDTQELDPWIGRNSRLLRLVLNGMNNLVSLPQLPDSILFLDAENCESLERLDCSFPNPDIHLNFANCFKLNEEAIDLIIQSSKSAVFPAREVPQCFTYRSSGSPLAVKFRQVGFWIFAPKFKACIIVADVSEKSFRYWKDASVCCSITYEGNALTTFYKKLERVFLGHLYTFEVEVETGKLASSELVFDFDLSYSDRFNMIKGCGILQLLDKFSLFSSINGDYKPTTIELVRKDYEPSDIESIRDRDSIEDYGPSDDESIRDSDEDYEPSDNEST